MTLYYVSIGKNEYQVEISKESFKNKWRIDPGCFGGTG